MLFRSGMSYHARKSGFANAAVVVNVLREDFYKGHPLDGVVFQQAIERAAFRAGGENYHTPAQKLKDFLAAQRGYLTSIADELIPVCDALDEYLLDGGKRLRPLFGYAGFLSTGKIPGKNDVRALSSLELLQACALIHDDLMDGSDTRRGKPSIHRQFETLHSKNSLAGAPAQFGQAAAVLLGDLALVWSDQMLHQSGISTESLTAALSIHDEMRVELMAGQYLDVREAGEKVHDVKRSLQIGRAHV